MEAIARLQPWSKKVEVVLQEVRHGEFYIAKGLDFEKVEEGLYQAPTFTLNSNDTQKLMDDLWHCGYRPSEGSGSAGQLAATQRHLEDMRTLVFKGGKDAKV
jgi:hypothetical protein